VLAALGWILDGIVLIGTYVLVAVETCVNVTLLAIVAAYTAAIALLPSMSSAPSLGSPQWLQWAVWFFPIGDLLLGLSSAVSVWAGFLLIRYVLRLVRGL
jgi:hypothetical protein